MTIKSPQIPLFCLQKWIQLSHVLVKLPIFPGFLVIILAKYIVAAKISIFPKLVLYGEAICWMTWLPHTKLILKFLNYSYFAKL